MADQEKQFPRLAEGGGRRAEERQDRQARALRENLLKRKAQKRARSRPGTSPPVPQPAPRVGDDGEP